jgi:hypothetical protein
MSEDVELATLLKEHQGELKAIAEAAGSGNRDKVIDGVSSFAISLATGNPLLATFAPLGRKGIARIFGNSVNAALTRELAAQVSEAERRVFLDQIGEVLEAMLQEALGQIVRSQHAAKDEVLQGLGGMRQDLAAFRQDFAAQLASASETVRADASILVQEVAARASAMLGRADRLFRDEARSDGLLLVEDDEILGGALLAHLDSRCAVVLALDVAEALRLVERWARSLRVALIDLSLPDRAGPNVPLKGGSELAARIWQSWPHIRLIGTSQFASARSARAVGPWFSAYIEKRDLLTDGAPSTRLLSLLQNTQGDARATQV